MDLAMFFFLLAMVLGIVAAFVSPPRVNLLALAIAALAAGFLVTGLDL